MFQLIKEETYRQQMESEAEPYLAARGGTFQAEREPGKKLSYVRYLTEDPAGIVMLSHGFTESTEKYREICFYFLKAGFHVYMPDHCGHGKSYRLTADPCLVHVDSYQRYVEDFIFLTKLAQKEQPNLPVVLFGHSMGGGIAAACAARYPDGYKKVILSSPMIRPLTYGVPFRLSGLVAEAACLMGRGEQYVMGTGPYKPEKFEDSASLSRARFDYYSKKREAEILYQTNAPSFSWARAAVRLNSFLRKKGYKTIAAPVLLLQAGKDTYVDNKEQDLFIEKINSYGHTKGELVRFEDAKHEIYNASDDIAEEYWNRIFSFLGRKF